MVVCVYACTAGPLIYIYIYIYIGPPSVSNMYRKGRFGRKVSVTSNSTWSYVFVYVCTAVPLIYIRTCLYTHTCARTYIYTHIRTRLYTHTCTRTYIYTHHSCTHPQNVSHNIAWAHTHTYIYTYMHTHIHIHTSFVHTSPKCEP